MATRKSTKRNAAARIQCHDKGDAMKKQTRKQAFMAGKKKHSKEKKGSGSKNISK